MKQALLFSLVFIVSFGQSQVMKVYYQTGDSVRIIVSGSIVGNGPGSGSDPIDGVLVSYISDGEDGSMQQSNILKGTTYYKPSPDTLIFKSNSGQNYLLLSAVVFDLGDTSNFSGQHYTVQVNDSIYQIGVKNVIMLEKLVTMIGQGRVSAVSIANSHVSSFDLLQNFPNPFNPTTNIEYHISKNSYVTLDIFNSTGQLIKSIDQGERSIGVYTVTWDGRDNNGFPVSSGSYFYQIRDGNSLQTKRMLLLK